MKITLRIIFTLLLLTMAMTCAVSCLLPQEPPASEDDDPSEKEEPEVADMGIWSKGYVSADGTGVIVESDEYIYTDVIELTSAGSRVTFTAYGCLGDTEEVLTLSFWNKTADGYELCKNAPHLKNDTEIVKKKSGGTTTFTYTATNAGEYVRFCYRVGPTFYGACPTIKTEKTAAQGTLKSQFERMEYLEMDKERAYFENLAGLRGYFIGDSLFGAHGIGKENCWIAFLGDKYGMNYENYGISGCTLSACEGGANPIINRYMNMSDEQPDFIVIEGGRNDFNKGAAIGSIDEKDPTTYLGALSMLVDGLREKYPNAIIIGVTFWNTNSTNKTTGISSNEYVDAMISALEDMDVPYVNAYTNPDCPVDMTDADFRAQYSYAPGDVCHLNVEGMKLVMPFFEKEISKILSAE